TPSRYRYVALDRAIAPSLDVPIDLLVEPRHRARAHPRAPQRFGDVFNAPHGYSRQVHLHQRFFDRRLAPSISLADRRLKRQPTQLRDLQLHLAGLRLELALVVTGSAIYPILR